MSRVISAALILFCCGGALAGGDLTDELLNQASGLYGALEFEKALRLLDKAYQVPGNSRAQLIRVYHIWGLCYGAIGRYQDAKGAFARLLALDPSFRLSPDVAPRIHKPFNELVKENPEGLGVRLKPPAGAVPGKPLLVTVVVASNPLGMARSLRVWFRRGEEGEYASVHSQLRGIGEYQISIPAGQWEGEEATGNVSWYAVVEGDHQGQLQMFGDAMHPLVLEVIGETAVATGPRAKRPPVKPPPPQKPSVVTPPPVESVPLEPPQLEFGEGEEDAWYQQWWVWALVGGVVVAASATALAFSIPGDSSTANFNVDVSTSP